MHRRITVLLLFHLCHTSLWSIKWTKLRPLDHRGWCQRRSFKHDGTMCSTSNPRQLFRPDVTQFLDVQIFHFEMKKRSASLLLNGPFASAGTAELPWNLDSSAFKNISCITAHWKQIVKKDNDFHLFLFLKVWTLTLLKASPTVHLKFKQSCLRSIFYFVCDIKNMESEEINDFWDSSG